MISIPQGALSALESQPSNLWLPLPDDLPFERWSEILRAVGLMVRASSWWLGDCVNFGETHYGELYAQALNDTELSEGTLRTSAWVARRFLAVRRRDSLSWSHHREVAGQPEETQEMLLDLAEERHWTRAELRAAMQEARRAPDVVLLPGSERPLSTDQAFSPGDVSDRGEPVGNAPLNLAVLTGAAARAEVARSDALFDIALVLPADPARAAPILARHYTLAALAAVWPKERLG